MTRQTGETNRDDSAMSTPQAGIFTRLHFVKFDAGVQGNECPFLEAVF
jgi:hypothetical protein